MAQCLESMKCSVGISHYKQKPFEDCCFKKGNAYVWGFFVCLSTIRSIISIGISFVSKFSTFLCCFLIQILSSWSATQMSIAVPSQPPFAGTLSTCPSCVPGQAQQRFLAATLPHFSQPGDKTSSILQNRILFLMV